MRETHIKPHWSFWVICIVALIWNVMGSINFIMQMTPNMLAKYPEAAQSLITSRPQITMIHNAAHIVHEDAPEAIVGALLRNL